MQILLEKDKLVFFGTVRELRLYLRSLPVGRQTLRRFIISQLH
jgi:hypothetical protein